MMSSARSTAPNWKSSSPLLVDPGTVIGGKYRIAERIGAGGMGEVYRATQVQPMQDVAIKILLPQLMKDHADRFMAEAERAAQVRHPHCVTIHEVGRDKSGLLFIAMEYIPGCDLWDLIEAEGPRSPKHDPVRWPVRALRIAGQICDVLHCAHSLKPPVIHRDLKPRNIRLWNASGSQDFAKLLDFGIAKQLGSTGFTRSGGFLGTPAYISPEQVEGKEIDCRSDLYSLGIVIYEMLSGEQPFQSTSDYDTAWKRVQAEPLPIRDRAANIGPEAEELVNRLLQRDPDDRYADAASTRAAIEEAIAAEISPSVPRTWRIKPDPVSEDDPTEYEPKPEVKPEEYRPVPYPLKIAGVAAAAALLLFAGYKASSWFGENGQESQPPDLRAHDAESRPLQRQAVAETVFVPTNTEDDLKSIERALQAKSSRDSTRLVERLTREKRQEVSEVESRWQNRYSTDSTIWASSLGLLQREVDQLESRLIELAGSSESTPLETITIRTYIPPGSRVYLREPGGGETDVRSHVHPTGDFRLPIQPRKDQQFVFLKVIGKRTTYYLRCRLSDQTVERVGRDVYQRN